MGIFSRKHRDRTAAAPQDTHEDDPLREEPQGPQDGPENAPQDAPQDAPRTAPQDAPPSLPPAVVEQGGSWIYEVAGEYSTETWAPPESIRRWWEVDRDGNVIGGPVENEHFGPPQDDLTRATDPDGPLGWLTDPETAIRNWLAVALERIVEGVGIRWLKVIDTPVVLAGNDASDFAPPDFGQDPPSRIGVAVPVGFGGQVDGHDPAVAWGLLLWVMVTDGSEENTLQNVWIRYEVEAERADESLRIVLQAPDIQF
ncbi:hypothetical protein [Kitasatospora sp. NPDC097691]|uniref:hypothetical protein n=1 Tax=Kitasatospora sp. NPDC097691 TaxID=3157231 RepID=UPI00331CDE91